MAASRFKTDLDSLVLPRGAALDDVEGNRFSVVFTPHETLWIDMPVEFEFRVPISYPAMPPVVTCKTTRIRAVCKDAQLIDAAGKVSMKILNIDGGWSRNYTLSDVVHSLLVFVKKEGIPVAVSLGDPREPGPRALCCTSGHFSAQGTRNTMEDETSIFDELVVPGTDRRVAFYAVFDGHGGCGASKFAAAEVHKHLLRHLSSGKPGLDALYHACLEADAAFVKKRPSSDGRGEQDQSGTTAVMTLIDGNHLITACLGDSRAVLCRAGTVLALSQDQKANSPAEVARIVRAGGFVVNGRVLGYLAVARAIGDPGFKASAPDGPQDSTMVTAEPEFTDVVASSRDEFLVLACDGLFDVMDNQAVVSFVRPKLQAGMDLNEIAKQLTTAALKAGSMDNVSVVVVKLGDGVVDSSATGTTDSPIIATTSTATHARKSSTFGELPTRVLGAAGASLLSPAMHAPSPAPAPAPASAASTAMGSSRRGPGSFGPTSISPVVPTAVLSPRVAAMSEAERENLSRKGARLLTESGLLGSGAGSFNTYSGSSSTTTTAAPTSSRRPPPASPSISDTLDALLDDTKLDM